MAPAAFTIDMRSVDVLIGVENSSSVGSFSALLPPATVATNPIVLGTPSLDNVLNLQVYQVPFSTLFALNNLSEYAAFQALFRQYRINRVTAEFQLTSDPNRNTPNFYSPTPELIIAEDVLDAGVVGDADDLLRYQNAQRQVLSPNRPYRYRGVPKLAMLAYGSLGGEYAVAAQPMWLNTVTSADAQHYLFKACLRNFDGNNGTNLAVRVAFTFNISFRGVF